MGQLVLGNLVSDFVGSFVLLEFMLLELVRELGMFVFVSELMLLEFVCQLGVLKLVLLEFVRELGVLKLMLLEFVCRLRMLELTKSLKLLFQFGLPLGFMRIGHGLYLL